MASRKWSRPSVPTVGLVDTSLEKVNRSADVMQVIINSMLHPLKICSRLQIMLPKLSRENCDGSMEAEEDPRATTGTIGGG